jgi:hypothetical protein
MRLSYARSIPRRPAGGPMRLDFTEFPKQFLLHRRDLAVDAGARHAEFAGWRVQAAAEDAAGRGEALAEGRCVDYF